MHHKDVVEIKHQETGIFLGKASFSLIGPALGFFVLGRVNDRVLDLSGLSDTAIKHPDPHPRGLSDYSLVKEPYVPPE